MADTLSNRREWSLGLAAGLATAACRASRPTPVAAPPDATKATVGCRLTYLGTATVLIEVGATRLMTDPAFDPAGTAYRFAVGARSTKLEATARNYDAVGPLDAVLLTHDQHEDNLDFLGRELLLRKDVARVITTTPGQRRLGARRRRDKAGHYTHRTGLGIADKLTGLEPWETTSVAVRDVQLRIVATPAKHGPTASPKVRQVIGFAMHGPGLPCIFVSGDTVWFDELAQVRDNLDIAGVPSIDIALIHCGGVQIPGLPFFGKDRFTFDGAEALLLAREVSARWVVPVHYEGWAHFRQPAAELKAVLAADPEVAPRVVWLEPGQPWSLPGVATG